jgi:predicted RNA-binding Zn ribbon-like protein
LENVAGLIVSASGHSGQYGGGVSFGTAVAGVIMTRWLLFALIVWLAASVAQAQAPAAAPALAPRPSPKMAVSGYCLAASAAFLESEAKASEEMKKCGRGDTIVIPAKSASAVARWCDFSKSIVATPDHVVCVILTPERVSK